MDHEVFLYYAPQHPTSRPLVERVKLSDLPKSEYLQIATLYVPPVAEAPGNEENLEALGKAGCLSA